MSAFLRFYQVVAYYASFALFAALAFGLNCFCLAVGWIPGIAGRERFFQRLVHREFAVFVWWVSFARIVPVRYHGFARWPRRNGLVIVANHPGLMDTFFGAGRPPARTPGDQRH